MPAAAGLHGRNDQAFARPPACTSSQAVFAAYLNASISTVQKWEIGEKKPSGAAARLLSVIERKGLEVLF
jgi:DNA-binding transcriptional regulator YiaG